MREKYIEQFAEDLVQMSRKRRAERQWMMGSPEEKVCLPWNDFLAIGQLAEDIHDLSMCGPLAKTTEARSFCKALSGLYAEYRDSLEGALQRLRERREDQWRSIEGWIN